MQCNIFVLLYFSYDGLSVTLSHFLILQSRSPSLFTKKKKKSKYSFVVTIVVAGGMFRLFHFFTLNVYFMSVCLSVYMYVCMHACMKIVQIFNASIYSFVHTILQSFPQLSMQFFMPVNHVLIYLITVHAILQSIVAVAFGHRENPSLHCGHEHRDKGAL